jgi:tRNA uracil 4-sulfurtransferase
MGLILLRYGEVALKGRNRHLWLRRLRRNIRACLEQTGLEGTVQSMGQRVYVDTPTPDAALEPLQRVFGLVSLSPVAVTALDLDAITAEALRQAQEAGLDSSCSFRVQARRANKAFPLNSTQVNWHVGAAVARQFGASVDLSRNADVTIGIEISDRAMLFHRIIPAHGGLPLGVEGRVVALISGGIDSPVAAWLLMKRGCTVIPVHFDQSETETQKALDNVDQLRRYSYGWELRPSILDHAALLEPVIQGLRRSGEERWTCVLCKRAILRAACEVAEQYHAHAVVMGDSLGQVASQSLPNMEVISYGMPKPILRPLIGMDKTEIIELAREIGTFDISTRDSAPCPFLPEHPITRGTIEHLIRLEAALACEKERS